MPTDELKALHTALIDARKGYEEAREDADKSDIAALFQNMLAMRDRHHGEIHKLLAAAGETPDESGSFMSTVHRTVIGVRAAVTGLDAKSLSAFASGEERIVDDYDRAILEAQGSPETVSVLTAQKSEVEQKIAAMKRMAAA